MIAPIRDEVPSWLIGWWFLAVFAFTPLAVAAALLLTNSI